MENTEQSPNTETAQPEQVTAESVKGKTAAELQVLFEQNAGQEEGNSETVTQESSTEEESATDKPTETQAAKEEPVQSQFDYKKAYENLQPAFTKISQELSELRKSGAPKAEQAKVESKLAQIRKENPEAATIFDELKNEVREELRKEIKPIEERVVLRTKRENIESFSKAAEDFKKSEYAELQPELDKILHEVSGDDEHLYSNIEDNPGFFEYAMSVLMYRHRDKVKEIILKSSSKTSKPDITAEIKGNPALRKSGASTVAGKSVTTLEDARKLSKADLESLIPTLDE